ncbi:hypothetical protein HPB52_022959 [Rhipicephalus sanguineus]|uniref:Uncharacterized protein n=1 Tax=Rhipicephalus sanguineus TaxID=34632 RepID=A0A9D4STD8_RHISA|nr:hypothetical protein HPB52_022959 [Rhipicephalus sanguineus]
MTSGDSEKFPVYLRVYLGNEEEPTCENGHFCTSSAAKCEPGTEIRWALVFMFKKSVGLRPQPQMSSSESILIDQPQAHLPTSRQSLAECVASASRKKSMAAEDTFIEVLPVLSGSASRGMAEVIDAPPEDGPIIGPSGRLACDSADDDGQFILTDSVQHECRTGHHKAVCVYGEPDAHRSDGRARSGPPRISSSATLPETMTTLTQVPVPVVYDSPFAKVPEEPMAHITLLPEPLEPLLLLQGHSVTECAPDQLTLSDKVLGDKRKKLALSLIREPVDAPSSFPKKRQPCSSVLYRTYSHRVAEESSYVLLGAAPPTVYSTLIA